MSEACSQIACRDRYYVRQSHWSELPQVTECCVAAFTRFEVFGPPWSEDAGILPGLLQCLPGAIIRLALERESQAIVGVAAWLPRQMRMGPRQIRAACLVPLAVSPTHHGQGIGSLLMHDGLQLLRQRGVSLLFLCGHERYYPRFGLLSGCLGRQACSIALPLALAQDPPGYTLRPLQVGDEVFCQQWWQKLCGACDGALQPDGGLLPWSSKTRDIVACVLQRGDLPVAYARFDNRPRAGAQDGVLRFLAADAAAAMTLCARIVAWTGWHGPRLVLPLSAHASAVQALFAAEALHAEEQWWAPGMAMALGDEACAETLHRIQHREAPPLLVEWPSLFDY